ncbi:MAG: Omp28 family outer membrane lipoprotein [Bacteroidales bacterium]|nr:Omp28 family outer membrane lipoprotein [Bacteroidales bacterium]
MKIKLTIALLTLFTVIFMAGCDKIDPPYINESGGGGGGDGEIVQKVLLEDYTGHTCVNCPAAAKIASDLQKFYGEKLIVMAVHTGFFADPMQPPFDTDFRTETGDKWRTDFGIVSYPSGMINRGFFDGTQVAGKGLWASRVDAAMQVTAKASLKIEANYTEANRQLGLKIDSHFLQNTGEKYLLQVCLVEDSIMAPQRNNDPSVGETPTITEYYHRHVLRKSLSGTNGEVISSVSIVADEVYSHEYNITLDTDYNADRCSIIAFIYSEADGEIVQVEEAHIK